jgi:NADH-quinone oxidoreductase subunit L
MAFEKGDVVVSLSDGVAEARSGTQFFGEERIDPHVKEKVHESPWTMVLPLCVLAVLSICGGFLGRPASLGGSNYFEKWLEPVLAHESASGEGAAHAAKMIGTVSLGPKVAWAAEEGEGHGGAVPEGHGEGAHHDPMEYTLMIASVAWALLAIFAAYICYLVKPGIPKAVAARLSAVHQVLLNKYYVDEIYYGVFVDGLIGVSKWCWSFVDVMIIDGLVNGTGRLVRAVGGGLRKVQTGQVQAYALSIVFGAVLLVAYFAFAFAFQG